MTSHEKQEKLNQLREARKETIDAVRARVKQNRVIRKELVDSLSHGPKTVPEIAQETGIPSHQVLWRLSSMKKYGKVAEGEQSGDYFQYVLLQE
ncbi:MAG TPA: hypothetical protein VMC85_08560 [Desulfomonilaceae bacterium]|nr:hypothetical protein [Desulfomonilaceae bacterium]